MIVRTGFAVKFLAPKTWSSQPVVTFREYSYATFEMHFSSQPVFSWMLPSSQPVHAGAQTSEPYRLWRDANLCVRLSKKLIFVETGYDVSTLSCDFVNTSVDITSFLVNASVVTTGSRGRPKRLSHTGSDETPIFNLYASFIKGHSRRNRLWRVVFLSLDTTGC